MVLVFTWPQVFMAYTFFLAHSSWEPVSSGISIYILRLRVTLALSLLVDIGTLST